MSLAWIYGGSAAWADWDGDEDLDLLVTGSDFGSRYTIFYENSGGTLSNTGDRGLPDAGS